jgi:hypothetical protein
MWAVGVQARELGLCYIPKKYMPNQQLLLNITADPEVCFILP